MTYYVSGTYNFYDAYINQTCTLHYKVAYDQTTNFSSQSISNQNYISYTASGQETIQYLQDKCSIECDANLHMTVKMPIPSEVWTEVGNTPIPRMGTFSFDASLSAPSVISKTVSKVWDAAKKAYKYAFGVSMSPGQTLDIYSLDNNSNIYSTQSNSNGYAYVTGLYAQLGDALTLFDNRINSDHNNPNNYIYGSVLHVPTITPYDTHVLSGSNQNSGKAGAVYDVSYCQGQSGVIIISGKVNASEIYIYDETTHQWLDIVDGVSGVDQNGNVHGDIDQTKNGVVDFKIAVNKGDKIAIYTAHANGSVNTAKRLATLYTNHPKQKDRDKNEGACVFALPSAPIVVGSEGAAGALSMDTAGAVAISSLVTQGYEGSDPTKAKKNNRELEKPTALEELLAGVASFASNNDFLENICKEFDTAGVDKILEGITSRYQRISQQAVNNILHHPDSSQSATEMEAIARGLEGSAADLAAEEALAKNLMAVIKKAINNPTTGLLGALASLGTLVGLLAGKKVLNGGDPFQYSLITYGGNLLKNPQGAQSYLQPLIGVQVAGFQYTETFFTISFVLKAAPDDVPGTKLSFAVTWALDDGTGIKKNAHEKLALSNQTYLNTLAFDISPFQRPTLDSIRSSIGSSAAESKNKEGFHIKIAGGGAAQIGTTVDMYNGETTGELAFIAYSKVEPLYNNSSSNNPEVREDLRRINRYNKVNPFGFLIADKTLYAHTFNPVSDGSSEGGGAGGGTSKDNSRGHGNGYYDSALDVGISGFSETLKDVGISDRPAGASKDVASKWVADGSKYDHNKAKNHVDIHYSKAAIKDANLITVHLSSGNTLFIYLTGPVDDPKSRLKGVEFYDSHNQKRDSFFFKNPAGDHLVTLKKLGIKVSLTESLLKKVGQNKNGKEIEKRSLLIEKM